MRSTAARCWGPPPSARTGSPTSGWYVADRSEIGQHGPSLGKFDSDTAVWRERGSKRSEIGQQHVFGAEVSPDWRAEDVLLADLRSLGAPLAPDGCVAVELAERRPVLADLRSVSHVPAACR